MATFLAKITVFEGKEAEFEEVAKEMFRATRTNMNQTADDMNIGEGAEPRTYYCMESFDDYLGFMKHQTSDHHEAPDFGSLLENLELEWIDPIQGACDLTETNSMDIPEGSSELMRQYAESMPAVVQAWWQRLR